MWLSFKNSAGLLANRFCGPCTNRIDVTGNNATHFGDFQRGDAYKVLHKEADGVFCVFELNSQFAPPLSTRLSLFFASGPQSLPNFPTWLLFLRSLLRRSVFKFFVFPSSLLFYFLQWQPTATQTALMDLMRGGLKTHFDMASTRRS